MRGSTARAALAVALVAIGLTGLTAQTKRPPTFADYAKWETLVQTGSRGGLSPDGHWLVYGINRSNRDNELVILNLAGDTTQPSWRRGRTGSSRPR